LTYDAELAALANSGFVTYVPSVSRPEHRRNVGWEGATGRANTLFETLLRDFALDPATTLVYACGHPGMIEDVKHRAARLGFEVQEERFWVDDDNGTD
jgi:ferredoxin--NADP+ reductase